MSTLTDAIAIEVFGELAADAKARSVCVRCKQPPTFYSDAGRREYGITGLCEPCFDTIMADPDTCDDCGWTGAHDPEVEH